LPVVAVDVEFRERSGGTSYATTLSFSNRRAPFSGAAFMRPAVTGQAFGGEGDALMQAAEMGQGHHLAGLSGLSDAMGVGGVAGLGAMGSAGISGMKGDVGSGLGGMRSDVGSGSPA
jgi:hypothetical protein